MTQEDKELLFKDLCARLPYGVIIQTLQGNGYLNEVSLTIFGYELGVNIKATKRERFKLEECKPYLRLISSMNEEEEEEFVSFTDTMFRYGKDNDLCCLPLDAISLLNAHHFDYRGLIEKRLALEAPEEMYNLKEK